MPLAFYPTLMLATQHEREQFEICHSSVYWPFLDCDIASDHLLRGLKEARNYAARAKNGSSRVFYQVAVAAFSGHSPRSAGASVSMRTGQLRKRPCEDAPTLRPFPRVSASRDFSLSPGAPPALNSPIP